MVKQAEVSGALAALVDEGIVKVASVEDFEDIAQVISENLPEQYDADDFFAKTAEVMDEVYVIYEGANDGMDKVAEEDALAYIGVLALQKEAGEITQEEFVKEAGAAAEIGARAPGMVADFLGAGAKATGKAIRGGVGRAANYIRDTQQGLLYDALGKGRRYSKGMLDSANTAATNAAERVSSLSGKAKAFKGLTTAEIAKLPKSLREQASASFRAQRGVVKGRKQLAEALKDKLHAKSRMDYNKGRQAKALLGIGTGLGAAGYGGKKLYDKLQG